MEDRGAPWSSLLRVTLVVTALRAKAVGVVNVRAFACLVLGGALAMSGCAGPAEGEGPLEFDEFGTAVGMDAPVYFGVRLCVRDESAPARSAGRASVTFDDVEAVQVTGTDRPITFRIGWPYGPPFDRVTAARGPVPDAYLPVEGASGELSTCGPVRERYGVLGVVLPSAEGEPITVQDLRVSYEVAGESFTETVDVSFTQCPDGTRPAGPAEGCRRPRAAPRSSQ